MESCAPRKELGGRAVIVVIASVAIMASGALPALANEGPVLVSSRPRIGGPIRSDAANPIAATYDRDLNEYHWLFEVFDGTNNAVAGQSIMIAPRSDTGGYRTIGFRPAFPMSEAGNPYTARIRAVGAIPTGLTNTIFSFTIDDTPPAPPVITDPLNGEVVTDQPVVLRGSAEAGAFLTVSENGDTIANDRAADSTDFDVFLPYPPEDGVAHTVSLYAVDEAGNIGISSAPVTFTHDSVVHQPVIASPAEGAFLNTTSVVVAGTAKPNTAITVTESATTVGTASADESGSWSTTIGFAPGSHTIAASSFDGVFTDGPSVARHFTIDVSAPGAPAITTPAPGAQLNTRIVTIGGTAEPHATVRVRESNLLRASTEANNAGAWSVALSFTEGAHLVTAAAVDAAGNVGPSASVSFTVDTVAPAAPTITTPAQGTFVNSNPTTVSGAAEAGAVVRVLEGSVAIGTTTANGSGAWSASISFTNAAHTITATATDAAGNTGGQSAPRSFTIDTVAPAAPVIVAPAEGSTVSTNAVTVSGTAEASTSVRIAEGVSTLAVPVTAPNGVWSATVTFANGAHTITATATDLAGNTGPSSAPRSFTVAAPADVVAPAAPSILDPAASSIQPGFVVFDGSAEAGATVRVFEGSVVRGSATADGSGNWQVGATVLSGAHTVTATATDPAGNESAPSAPRSFTVDAKAPTVAFTTASGTILLPGDPVILTGTAADNLAVDSVVLEYSSITGEHVLTAPAACTGCPGTPVAWQATPTLPPGIYTAKAFAVDLAGNRSIPAQIRFIRL